MAVVSHTSASSTPVCAWDKGLFLARVQQLVEVFKDSIVKSAGDRLTWIVSSFVPFETDPRGKGLFFFPPLRETTRFKFIVLYTIK
ncbi:hypothetical protein CEXT_224961 [Caerostris extrusa]|uniref:Uncharacterized protein n=1 Tax=Caerostris extrusa TaxID=172846 RepID=A0AAV4XWN8_CAEEX|nr:hypothetical protein CEXT_224961 [Caerostris extrusa]